MKKCEFFLNPPGFPAGVEIDSPRFHEWWVALSYKVRADQAAIVSSLAKVFPTLKVTAPTFDLQGPRLLLTAGFYCVEDHHHGSDSVDFGGSPSLLMRAFLGLMASDSPFALGLGLNGPSKGYNAMMHLHVGAGPKSRFIETGFAENTYQGQKGFIVTYVTQQDRIIKEHFFFSDPSRRQPLENKLVKGIWAKTLDDAKQLYGVSEATNADVSLLNQSNRDSQSPANWPLLLMVVGAGIGYQKNSYARLALYAAAGFAIGTIVDRANSLLPSNPLKPS